MFSFSVGSQQKLLWIGAEENVCPVEWGQQFGLQSADRWMLFRIASGDAIEHFGKRAVKVVSFLEAGQDRPRRIRENPCFRSG